MSKRTLIQSELVNILKNEKAYLLPSILQRYDVVIDVEDDPMHSRRMYLEKVLSTMKEEELFDLGKKVSCDYESSKLSMLNYGGVGVKGNLKNIVFAADGVKPDFVIIDFLNNDIKIESSEDNCLMYNRPILDSGLRWKELVDWWSDKSDSIREVEKELYCRLIKSLDSAPEKLMFKTYYTCFNKRLGVNLPALIPQVYLHFDPYTFKELKGVKRLERQRMDFLLLLSNGVRVIIEIDGKQHYSKENKAKPELYSKMVEEDRRLKLSGYEIYRFGGYELTYGESEELIVTFFENLFKKYNVV